MTEGQAIEERDWLADLVASAPSGPRIELGVLSGDSLDVISADGTATFGVDSFRGMGDPGPEDAEPDGTQAYPRGRLARPLADVRRRFAGRRGVVLVQGWVPQVLSQIPIAPWAFAHVDLDHYAPTRDALIWLMVRMRSGGVLCCDDYFPGRGRLAGLAIDEFARRRPITGSLGQKCFWRFP